jgi:hypothetical protein
MHPDLQPTNGVCARSLSFIKSYHHVSAWPFLVLAIDAASESTSKGSEFQLLHYRSDNILEDLMRRTLITYKLQERTMAPKCTKQATLRRIFRPIAYYTLPRIGCLSENDRRRSYQHCGRTPFSIVLICRFYGINLTSFVNSTPSDMKL